MRAGTQKCARGCSRSSRASVLEATQGQIDGFFSQLPYKCHLFEVASVGYRLKICPQLNSTGITASKDPEVYAWLLGIQPRVG